MSKKKKPRKGRSPVSYAAPIIAAETVELRVGALADSLSDMMIETRDLAKNVKSSEQYIAVIHLMNIKWADMRKILLKNNITFVPEDWYLRSLMQVSPGISQLVTSMVMSALKTNPINDTGLPAVGTEETDAP